MKKLLIAAAVIALAGSALAQTAHKVVRVEEVTWVDDPLFKGVKTAILGGDPTQAEVIVLRMKIPPHYRILPHSNPFDEVLALLTGRYGNGSRAQFQHEGELTEPRRL